MTGCFFVVGDVYKKTVDIFHAKKIRFP
jgi:hypothetical protein